MGPASAGSIRTSATPSLHRRQTTEETKPTYHDVWPCFDCSALPPLPRHRSAKSPEEKRRHQSPGSRRSPTRCRTTTHPMAARPVRVRRCGVILRAHRASCERLNVGRDGARGRLSVRGGRAMAALVLQDGTPTRPGSSLSGSRTSLTALDVPTRPPPSGVPPRRIELSRPVGAEHSSRIIDTNSRNPCAGETATPGRGARDRASAPTNRTVGGVWGTGRARRFSLLEPADAVVHGPGARGAGTLQGKDGPLPYVTAAHRAPGRQASASLTPLPGRAAG